MHEGSSNLLAYPLSISVCLIYLALALMTLWSLLQMTSETLFIVCTPFTCLQSSLPVKASLPPPYPLWTSYLVHTCRACRRVATLTIYFDITRSWHCLFSPPPPPPPLQDPCAQHFPFCAKRLLRLSSSLRSAVVVSRRQWRRWLSCFSANCSPFILGNDT